MILPTAGAAEAFTLIARGLGIRHPLVAHPQFTEPEAALRASGLPVQRLLLHPGTGFTITQSDRELLRTSAADLVMIGNPTNPTSVLHPRSELELIRHPGRVLVVDEAFMDAVPGAEESMIHDRMDGLLVTRSLTKSWGLAGLRAGYLVGDPDLIGKLRDQQQPWAVSTPALAAIQACTGARARTDLDALNRATSRDREFLIKSLDDLGLSVVQPARGPFVLVDTCTLSDASLREPLAARGFAVRRSETFPGLGASWMRLAVCDHDTTTRLVAALRDLAGLDRS